MKKIYQTPLTEIEIVRETYAFMAGSLTNDGKGNWSQPVKDGDDETGDEGRSNTSVWDTL